MPHEPQPVFYYHPNYEHGNPLRCFDSSADGDSVPCPHLTHNERFDNRAEARACYEEYMEKFTVPVSLTKENPDPVQCKGRRW